MRGRTLPWIVAGFAGLVGAAGCGAGPSAEGPAVVVCDSAGVVIVENARPAWTPETAWRVAEAPALEIGSVDGPEAYQLDGLSGAVRLSDGRIAIADGGSRRIRYYDAAGRHLRDVGGRGGGPGEFQALNRIVAMPGDSVAGWDGNARRLTVFDRDGRLGRTVTFDGLDGFSVSLSGVFDDGSVVVTPGEDVMELMSREAGEYRPTIVHLRFTADGAFVDTIAAAPGAERVAYSEGTSFGARNVLFGRDHHITLAGDRFYAGDSDAFAITESRLDGTVSRGIRRVVEPRAVSRDELRAAIGRRVDEATRTARRFAEVMESAVAEPDPADFTHRATYPAFDRLLVDADGHLWVRAYPVPEAESRDWSVFDPEGRWLGDVQTPSDIEILEIGRDYLLARWRDEFDVDHLRLYTMEKP